MRATREDLFILATEVGAKLEFSRAHVREKGEVKYTTYQRMYKRLYGTWLTPITPEEYDPYQEKVKCEH